jgi:hypothetical protein
MGSAAETVAKGLKIMFLRKGVKSALDSIEIF